MKAFRYITGIAASVALIVALLIGAVEICCFSDINFYRDEYEKIGVADTVGMTLDDLMDVTEVMTDYLQGKRDDLVIVTTMWGEQREFFNDREKGHMVDVQALNLGAVKVGWIAFCVSIVLFIIFALLFRGERLAKALRAAAKCMCFGTLLFLVTVGIGALIVSTDFDKYWRMFHTIFFTNDLWLLDPSTDMLINIVPLQFFIDLVSKCALLFGLFVLILLLASVLTLMKTRKIKEVAAILLAFAIGFSVTPIHTYAENAAPEITSDAAVVIERNSGAVLYSKNSEKSEYPASTTKVCTALLALENLDLDSEITFSKKAINSLPTGASHIGMKVGEVLTARECMYGLLLPSANEVANALAEAVDGDMDTFAEHMNERAAELGCVNTHFSNPSGLHAADHYTCAYDLALIFRQCLDTPEFIAIDSTVTHVIPATNLVDETRPVKTTHEMIRSDSEYYDSDVVCGKTGHTDEAGACLITYAVRGDLELIVVTMKAEAPNQYTDTETLLDYCFGSFSYSSAEELNSYIFDNSSDNHLAGFASETKASLYTVEPGTYLVPNDLSDCTFAAETDASGTPSKVDVIKDGQTCATLPLLEAETAAVSTGPCAKDAATLDNTRPDYTYVYVGIIVAVAIILIIVLLIFFSERNRRTRKYHRRKGY